MMKTKQAKEEFLASRCRLRPKTIRGYEIRLTKFEEAYPELPHDPQPLRAFLNALPVGDDTARGYHHTLRAMYAEASVQHPRLKNPMAVVKPPLVRRKVIRTFSALQLHTLFSQPLSLRNLALLTLLLDTGVRAGEAASLIWEEVFQEFVIVAGKTGEGIVPISAETYHLLVRLRQQDGRDGHVFMGQRGPLGYEGIYRAVKKLCHEAGITGRRSSPHTFRHTAGTLLIEAGCDLDTVQKILRHSSVKVTEKYVHQHMAPIIRKHHMFSPLKMVRAAAQGIMFEDEAIAEAERILEK